MSDEGVSFIAWRRKGRRALLACKMPVASSYEGFYDALTIRERGCGQFAQAGQSEALQERFRCRKAQPTVGAGEFLDKFEIPKFHHEPTLVGVAEAINFCLADRLLKGDAGENLEGCAREAGMLAREVLLTQVRSQRFVVDLGSEKGNYPVDDSQLKANQGELPVAGEKRAYQFHVTERRDGSRFGADLMPEKLAQLLAQSVHRETLSRREEELHDRLGGDLPHPFSLLSNLAHQEKKATRAAGGCRPMSEAARNRRECNALLWPDSYVQGESARHTGSLRAR
jgi:hypothetical protein